jgi:cation diffusion facilitator CzcD-associated flavoprotein CzcO
MHRTSKDQKASRDLVADIMREQLDNDSFLTKKMIPGFDLGCRRMTPGSGYLQSLRKGNVQVVAESVVKFTKDGLVDDSGTEHKVDVVVCATGFDISFTPHFEVTGRDGANIKEQFGENPKAYLSITAPNFPNMFCMFKTSLKLPTSEIDPS